MSFDFANFLSSQKSLPVTPQWIVDGSSWLSMTSPLDIDGVTISGARLVGKASLKHPDRHIVLQLEHHPYADSGGAICRLEWRPLNGHGNKRQGPKELRNLIINGSHYHPFDLIWKYCEKDVRKGQLPIAYPIQPDPANCREFLALVGREFKIFNIQCVGIPPWQSQLL